MHRIENMTRRVAFCAIGAGVLWALTPLRDRIFGAGGTPAEGVVAFRLYNAAVAAAVLTLTVSLALWLRRAERPGPALVCPVVVVQIGHSMLIVGSVSAVVLGGGAPSLAQAGQDIGFLGAMVAALGALPLGLIALRKGAMPRDPGVLFACTLPVGLLGLAGLAGLGVPEDLLGLPLTILYGGAFAALGKSWLTEREPLVSTGSAA